MSLFGQAIATIFRDRHMSVAAEYHNGWGGVPVRVILREPDRIAGFNEGRFVQATSILDVRVADVAEPKRGDSFVIDGEGFDIIDQPVRDSERLVWSCAIKPVAPSGNGL